MSDLTTSAGRDELRELAERRRGLSIGGYLVLEPEEVIALLDLAEHPADTPRIGNATDALQRLREAGGDAWDLIDDPEEYLGRRDHPPLTRERVEKAVKDLLGRDGAYVVVTTGDGVGLEEIRHHQMTDRLCRLLGVEE